MGIVVGPAPHPVAGTVAYSATVSLPQVAAKPAPQTIMRRFYDAFADQKHHVVTVFRQFDENHLGLLTPFEFGRAMRQFAHVTDFVVSDIDITVLTEYFFPEGASSYPLGQRLNCGLRLPVP